MELKTPVLVAVIGALGGLVGGGVTSVADYFFGLQAKRQELLQEARRNAYVDWLSVRTLSREVDQLESERRKAEADALLKKYDREGRAAMGKIATYGGSGVVRSAAKWYRTDATTIPCDDSSPRKLKAEIDLHQAMRSDLLPQEERVSDADMALLLLQCSLAGR